MRAAVVAVWTSLALASTAPAESNGQGSPEAFLRWLYAHYPMGSGAGVFDAMGQDAPRVFDASLRALMRADVRFAKGEVGLSNDSDAICQCQDDTGMRATISQVTSTGSIATANVRIRWQGGEPDSMVHIILRKQADGWRIHDIGGPDQPSLRRAIQQELGRAGGG